MRYIVELVIFLFALGQIYAKVESDLDTEGLRWRELSVAFKKEKTYYLVEPSSGFLKNGHVMGIIGPSGAGKSTFLSALIGFTPKHTIVNGSVWFDSSKNEGKSLLSVSSGHIAYLQQHDSFFSQLSVKETVNLAAFLQLELDKDDQTALVHNVIDSLGLRKVEFMRIGEQGHENNSLSSNKFGKLSGGERRRLSVALEILSNPRIIVADEPTTGLDSSQAKKVFDLIAKTAKERNIPCICTIHQPRAIIWKQLDSFILLAPGGKILYMGDRSKAIDYFSNLGYKCPRDTTPSEFFIDLVTIDTEDPIETAKDTKRIEFLNDVFKKHQAATASKNIELWNRDKALIFSKVPTKHKMRRPLPRIASLVARSLRQNLRDVRINLLRIATSVSLARLFSELFSNVKKGQTPAKSVADRIALLSFGVVNMSMMSIMKTLNLFGKEKSVVTREQVRRYYTSFDYLISKALAEIPLDVIYSSIFAGALKHFTCLTIPFASLLKTFSLLTIASASLGFAVGSFTNGVEEAMTVGMPLMVILMAVGIINPSGVDSLVKKPRIINLLKDLSPIGLSIEALCVEEYKGKSFVNEKTSKWSTPKWSMLKDLPKMGGLALVQNGDQVLEALALESKTYNGVMKRLTLLSVLNLLISLIGLSSARS